MKDEMITTSANPIGGVHICERCGKKLYWQDELPKCWCESLIERVAALEARMTRLEEAYEAPVHFDDDGKVTVCHALPPLAVCQEADAMMAKFKPTHEQEKKLQGVADFIKRREVEAAILAKAKPAIDWEKVAESRGFTIGWENMPDCWKHSEIEASKAAVAEYLRQVKEGAE